MRELARRRSRIRAFPIALGLAFAASVPGPGVAAEWVFRGGATRERPVTTGPQGYGNHGNYDGTNGAELDRADRRRANWDRAPGLVAELARKRSAAWTAPSPVPLSLAIEPYARLTLVDTEFNETQRDWWYLTQVFGGRAVVFLPGLPWLGLHAGAGAGVGYVAKRAAALGETEYGIEIGPVRGTWARQYLDGGRQVTQIYVTHEFPLGETAPREPLTTEWSLGVFSRLTRHPSRRVKEIHQTGASLTRRFGQQEDRRRLAVELEVSIAPVESQVRRPLREDVEHNYRTQDEVFWALYFGETRRLPSFPGLFVEFRAGLEAFYEDDDRVNAGEETGWFPGAKAKLGLWKQNNTLVSYGVNAVAGLDNFGLDYGVELAVATRL